MPGLLELSRIAIAGEKLDVCIQKYVATEEGPFKRVWVKPVGCVLELSRFDDSHMMWLKNGTLADLRASIVSAYAPRPGSSMPGMSGEAGVEDLVGMRMGFYYDCKHRVGIVVDARNTVRTYGYASKWKTVVSEVDLRVVREGQKLMNRAEMQQIGIPEELLDCSALLRKVSSPV